jgi:hypothetical protein
MQTSAHFEATGRLHKPVVFELLVISLPPDQTFEEVFLWAVISKGKVELSTITLVRELGNKEGIFFPNGPHHLYSK